MFPAIYLCLTCFSILFRLLPNIQMAYNLFISTCFFFFVYLDFLLLSFAFVCQLGSLRIGQTDRKRGNEEKRERDRERESEKEKLMLVVLCRVCYIHKKHVRCQFHCLVGASHNSRALSEKKMLLNSISI